MAGILFSLNVFAQCQLQVLSFYLCGNNDHVSCPEKDSSKKNSCVLDYQKWSLVTNGLTYSCGTFSNGQAQGHFTCAGKGCRCTL